MKKVIDMSKIKKGDIIETWNDSKDFMAYSRVIECGKNSKGVYVVIEDHNELVFICSVFAHYELVTK